MYSSMRYLEVLLCEEEYRGNTHVLDMDNICVTWSGVCLAQHQVLTAYYQESKDNITISTADRRQEIAAGNLHGSGLARHSTSTWEILAATDHLAKFLQAHSMHPHPASVRTTANKKQECQATEHAHP